MRVVVQEWERVLVYRDGLFAEVLGSGRHRRTRRRQRFVRVAVRLRLLVVAVAQRSLEDLLAERPTLADDVRAQLGAGAEAVGVAIERLWLRDVTVPAELRRAAAEAAVARAQGRAALERARSEVAATRAPANAARMVAETPALLQLRTLQAVEAGGATVVLTTGPAHPLGPW